MPTRRDLLASTGAIGAAGLAGCTGVLTEEGASFAAEKASLPADLQDETEYTEHRSVEEAVVREFTAFGFARTVEATNVITEYDRAIEIGALGIRIQAAAFATLSTPQVRILTQTFNPVADMTTVEIAETIQERYENVENVKEDLTFRTEVAGETTTATRFTAEARLVEIDRGIDIYIYVNEPVPIGDDFVVALAAHPRLFGRAEDTVRRLMAGVVGSGD